MGRERERRAKGERAESHNDNVDEPYKKSRGRWCGKREAKQAFFSSLW